MSAAAEPAVSEEYADFCSEKAMREADVSRKRDLVALHAASFGQKHMEENWHFWLEDLDHLVDAAQREWVEYLEFMDAATAPTVPPLPCLTCGCTRERDDEGERVCGCDSCQKNGCCYEPWDDEEECESCYRHDERKYAARQLAAEEEAADSYDGGYCVATKAAVVAELEDSHTCTVCAGSFTFKPYALAPWMCDMCFKHTMPHNERCDQTRDKCCCKGVLQRLLSLAPSKKV